MDIGSILLILSLFVLVGWFVARPFLEGSAPSASTPATQAVSVMRQEHDLSTLLAERERTINTLQELEFDFALGKVPAEEYPAQRMALLQRGAEILRQLDALERETKGPSSPLPARLAQGDELLVTSGALEKVASLANDDPLEAAIASRRARQATADDPLEVAIAARRRTRTSKSAGFCPKCGKPVQQADRFCPKCGVSLS